MTVIDQLAVFCRFLLARSSLVVFQRIFQKLSFAFDTFKFESVKCEWVSAVFAPTWREEFRQPAKKVFTPSLVCDGHVRASNWQKKVFTRHQSDFNLTCDGHAQHECST